MLILRGMMVAAALAASTALASAGTACYTANDMAGDQAMKYQTELMVYSDTCSHGITFTTFLKNNQAAITTYQHQLIDHYRAAGAHGAEVTLDNYLTYLANQVTLLIDNLPTDSFCSGKADYFADAEGLNAEKLHRLVAERVSEHQKEYVHCDTKAAVVNQ